jgi:hypothetical protein
LPATLPAALICSAASVTPFFISWPSDASGPVKGKLQPIV